jgi:hypothetical protein
MCPTSVSLSQHVKICNLTSVISYIPVTEYTDRLELKSTTERTFGVAVLPLEDELHDQGHGCKSLIVLTSATLMKVIVDRDQVAGFQPM